MNDIKKGERSDRVRRWQLFLIGLGEKELVSDKVFGKWTERATARFQRIHGVKADGIVGKRTYMKAKELGFVISPAFPCGTTGGDLWPKKPVFKPLTDLEVERLYGRFEYEVLANRSSILIESGWVKEHLKTIKMSSLQKLGPYHTQFITVHKNAVDQWQTLFELWAKEKLLKHLLTYEGSYNPRLMRGSTNKVSRHAYGLALDFNAKWNRLGARPAVSGSTGSLVELVEIANSTGVYWGGHYSRKDGMHFEVGRY